MNNDIVLIFCVGVIAFAGLYVGVRWALEIFNGWREAVAVPVLEPPRLVDAEAEGWLDELEWGFPCRRSVEACAGDQTGEMELPRVGVTA